MNIQQIVDEADILVPNELSSAEKIVFLNNIHQDFFNVVKISRILNFSVVKDQSNYVIDIGVREKNIDVVHVGVIKYKRLLSNTPNPLQNTYVFDDISHSINLSPAPYQEGIQGLMKYYYISTINFSGSDLTVTPDAPLEYHWTYSIALASYVANAMDDAGKSAMYETQYKAAWNKAAQNYAGSVAT